MERTGLSEWRNEVRQSFRPGYSNGASFNGINRPSTANLSGCAFTRSVCSLNASFAINKVLNTSTDVLAYSLPNETAAE